MEGKGKELWVGLFVLVGIVVICGMVLEFGKFRERFQKTYSFQVQFQNVGQIARGAPVITSGVVVGKVEGIHLEGNGTVVLKLAVWEGVHIRNDARFEIKQAGLLGDLHVVAIPQSEKAPLLKEGDVVVGVNPTDIQDTLEQAAQVVVKIKSAADNIESATHKLDKEVMNTETLTDLRQAISNINVASARADHLLEDVHGLLGKTTAGIDSTMANLNLFSTNLTVASSKTLDIIRSNEDDVRTAVQNIKSSSERLNQILSGVESGKGTIGKLVVDESFYQELKRLVANLRRFGVLRYKDEPLPKEGAGTGPSSALPAPVPVPGSKPGSL